MLTDEQIVALVMARPDMAQAIYHDIVPLGAFIELARAMLAAFTQPLAVSSEPVAVIREVNQAAENCFDIDIEFVKEVTLVAGVEFYLATPPSADAQDAARYRWLRANHNIHDNSPFICRNFGASFSQWTGEHADAAIDAAMANGEQQ